MQYMCCKSYVGSYKQMLHVDWLSGDASEWNTRQFAQICDLMDVTRHIPSNGLPTGAHIPCSFPTLNNTSKWIRNGGTFFYPDR